MPNVPGATGANKPIPNQDERMSAILPDRSALLKDSFNATLIGVIKVYFKIRYIV